MSVESSTQPHNYTHSFKYMELQHLVSFYSKTLIHKVYISKTSNSFL